MITCGINEETRPSSLEARRHLTRAGPGETPRPRRLLAFNCLVPRPPSASAQAVRNFQEPVLPESRQLVNESNAGTPPPPARRADGANPRSFLPAACLVPPLHARRALKTCKPVSLPSLDLAETQPRVFLLPARCFLPPEGQLVLVLCSPPPCPLGGVAGGVLQLRLHRARGESGGNLPSAPPDLKHDCKFIALLPSPPRGHARCTHQFAACRLFPPGSQPGAERKKAAGSP